MATAMKQGTKTKQVDELKKLQKQIENKERNKTIRWDGWGVRREVGRYGRKVANHMMIYTIEQKNV